MELDLSKTLPSEPLRLSRPVVLAGAAPASIGSRVDAELVKRLRILGLHAVAVCPPEALAGTTFLQTRLNYAFSCAGTDTVLQRLRMLATQVLEEEA